jgi:hypothetical protein
VRLSLCVFVPVGALLLAACGAFSTADSEVAASDAGGDGATPPTPTDGGDAAPPGDAIADVIVLTDANPALGVQCGAIRCLGGMVCCDGTNPKCAPSCGTDFAIACRGSADCPGTKCCLQGVETRCEATCSGRTVCGSNADCPQSNCNAGSCSKATTAETFALKACGSGFVDPPGLWSCTF